MHSIRVWDFPTRLFHWLLALCVVGLVVTAKMGGNAMEWHLQLGHAVLGLLIFRIVWGLVGGHWSRFAQFIYSPASLLAYVRGRSPAIHRLGHTPLGALSVFALLFALGAQVGTGLLSDDEIAFFGPLVSYVSSDTVTAATAFHKNVGQYLVIGLVVLHLLAIVYYVGIKRQTLVRAMVVGDKTSEQPLPASRDTARTRLLALVIATACATAAWTVSSLGASF